MRAVLQGCGMALLALCAAGPARADTTAGGAEVRAVGGVSRANVRSGAAVLTAPAVLPLVPRYQIQASGLVGPDALLGVRAYALDSNTGPVALGLAYHYDHAVPQTSESDLPGWVLPDDTLENELGRTVFGGGLATSFADRRVGLGVTLAWNQRATRFTELERWMQGGVSLAGRVGPEDMLVLAVAADNLFVPSKEVDPLTFGGGLAYRPVPAFALLGQLDVETGAFDGPAQVGFGGGVEVDAAQVVAIRGGFQRDVDRDSDLLTAGLGGHGEQAALDYAAEIVVGHGGEPPAGWEEARFRSYHTLTLTLSF